MISVSMTTGTLVGIVTGSTLGCALLTCCVCVLSCVYCPRLRKYRDVLERQVAVRDRQAALEEASLLTQEQELSVVDQAKACAKVAVAADQAGFQDDAVHEYRNAVELIEKALSSAPAPGVDARKLRTFRTAYVTRIDVLTRTSTRKANGSETSCGAESNTTKRSLASLMRALPDPPESAGHQ